MFLEKLLEGLSWGLFVVAILTSIASFSIAWSWLGPILKKSEEKEELLTNIFEKKLEEKPPLPDNEEPPPRYRFVPSTIVRPPNVVRRKDRK